MNVSRSNYEGMNWVDALKEAKKPRNYEERLAEAEEKDVVDNALEQTVEAVFNVPTSEETSKEAITRASKDIQDVVSRDANESVSKFRNDRNEQKKEVEVTANRAQQKKEWQEQVLKAVQPDKGFNPEVSKAGKITSSASGEEDSTGRKMNVPVNANSIFDPFRLDKLATEENERDKLVKDSREEHEARSQKWAKEATEGTPGSPISMNEGARIMRSGGQDQAAFVQRVPSNQISMLDVKDDGASKDQRTESIKELFSKKVQDIKADSQKAAQERKENIQRKKEEDRSWEKVATPQNTSDISRRLMELWLPNKKKE
jgi:hypothetical protein